MFCQSRFGELFPNRYEVLELSDRPDLRHLKTNTGIEVTYSKYLYNNLKWMEEKARKLLAE